MSTGSSHRKRYSAVGGMGLPSILVAAAWFALWLVWIPLGGGRPAGKSPSATRPVFSHAQGSSGMMDPRDIILLQRETDEMDEMSGSVISHYQREPRYLKRERDGGHGDESTPAGSGSLALGRPGGGDGGYAPGRLREPVFTKPVERPAVVQIRCSGQLEAYVFALPDPVAKELAGGKAAWQIAVYVETDENGRVEHVLLDQGGDDPVVDRAVLNAVYRGHLLKQGVRCGGTVTLSFPGEGKQGRDIL